MPLQVRVPPPPKEILGTPLPVPASFEAFSTPEPRQEGGRGPEEPQVDTEVDAPAILNESPPAMDDAAAEAHPPANGTHPPAEGSPLAHTPSEDLHAPPFALLPTKGSPGRLLDLSDPRRRRIAIAGAIALGAAVLLSVIALVMTRETPAPDVAAAPSTPPSAEPAPPPSGEPAPAAAATAEPEPAAAAEEAPAPPPTGAAPSASATSKPPTKPFDKAAARAALDALRPELAGCKLPKKKEARIKVTFAPTGHVTSAAALAPFAGTAQGSCLATRVKKAEVAPFKGGATPYVYTYPAPHK